MNGARRDGWRPGVSELASYCFTGDLTAAAEALVSHAHERRGGYVCMCNVHVLTEALHDDRLRDALLNAAIRFPDGVPVAWLLRRLGQQGAIRIGGPDLLPEVVDRGRKSGLRHFFVGSTADNLARITGTIEDRYPGASIVGRYAPPFADEPSVDAKLVEEIVTAGADVVWVSLGAPKQELWMVRASPLLPDATLVGVGAAFDFVGGAKRRAPGWMRNAGLEWLHRLASEPLRLVPRYARSNPEFIGRVGIELTRRRLRGAP